MPDPQVFSQKMGIKISQEQEELKVHEAYQPDMNGASEIGDDEASGEGFHAEQQERPKKDHDMEEYKSHRGSICLE